MRHLFIVGAQRCGSTYLYKLLDGHPQIYMAKPVRPEPKYFLSEENIDKGEEYYISSYFPDPSIYTVYFGEKSTSYIEYPEAIARIANWYSDARILVILRDPVIRAWSNYRFSLANKLETLSFEEALRLEDRRLSEKSYITSVNPFAYRRRGYFIDYIERLAEFFPLTQIEILILEEIVCDANVIHTLFQSLEIDPMPLKPGYQKPVNKGVEHDSPPLDVFVELATHYMNSVIRLENLLGRTLTHWRKSPWYPDT